MKNFLIGFLVAVVGCITAFIALIAWFYTVYREADRDFKNKTHEPRSYIDYAKYSHEESDGKYSK